MPRDFKNNPYSHSFVKGQSDPYSWAGELGVEKGPVPFQRWRPSIVRTKPGENDGSIVEESNDRVRSELKGAG